MRRVKTLWEWFLVKVRRRRPRHVGAFGSRGPMGGCGKRGRNLVDDEDAAVVELHRTSNPLAPVEPEPQQGDFPQGRARPSRPRSRRVAFRHGALTCCSGPPRARPRCASFRRRDPRADGRSSGASAADAAIRARETERRDEERDEPEPLDT